MYNQIFNTFFEHFFVKNLIFWHRLMPSSEMNVISSRWKNLAQSQCGLVCNSNERDWWLKGPRIDSKLGHSEITTLGKLFAHVPLFTKQYNLVPVVKARWCSASGKVTVGLASHWPCVTDSSGLSTYGLNGRHMRDEHLVYAPDGAWPGLLCLLCEVSFWWKWAGSWRRSFS